MSTNAKVVRVGLAPATLSGLAGSSAELSVETSQIDNSIFGTEFSSQLAGVSSFSLSANAWLRRTAGFKASVKRAGNPTPFTTEAFAQVGSTKTYRIVDQSKEVWDTEDLVVIFDDGTEVDAVDIAEIDPMFGRVTFAANYTVTGPITATGSFLTLADQCFANSVDLTQNAESIDISDFCNVAEEDGFVVTEYGTKTVSASLSGFYRAGNDFFEQLKARESFVLEFDFDGEGNTVARGVFTITNYSQSGDQGSVEDLSLDFQLSVPEGYRPFSWNFTAESEASQSFKDVVNAWLRSEYLHFQYLPFGVNQQGFAGKGVIDDASLSVSVDSIAELTVSLSGSGELERTI